MKYVVGPYLLLLLTWLISFACPGTAFGNPELVPEPDPPIAVESDGEVHVAPVGLVGGIPTDRELIRNRTVHEDVVPGAAGVQVVPQRGDHATGAKFPSGVAVVSTRQRATEEEIPFGRHGGAGVGAIIEREFEAAGEG